MTDSRGEVATPGLLVIVSRDGIDIRSSDHVVTDSQMVLGAVFGVLDAAESATIVRRLAAADDPGQDAPDVPWAALARRSDGSVVATCSMLLPSGLFVAADESAGRRRWVVATDPGSVLRARGGPAEIDADYVRAFARVETSPWATPYVGVTRVPAGETLIVWPGEDPTGPRGRARTTSWCGPSTMAPPNLRGTVAVRRYVEVFDEVVENLARRSGPLVATVSGGLDSTFVAASLVRAADRSNPVRGFCYSPLVEAQPNDLAARDADDLPYALLMARQYPGLLTVSPMRNTRLVRPLAAAAAASHRSWLPTFAPANRIWLDQFQEQIAAHGAGLGFIGTHGNASFSFGHGYHLGGARRVRRAIGRRRPGSTVPPLASSADRAGYLDWLTGRRGSLAAAGHPAATGGLLRADPFAARAIIELAASISPGTWQRHGSRGFAREAGNGRVPDAIRLRTRRGAQASDCWHVVQHDRDEHLDRAHAAAGVPGLEDVAGSDLVGEVEAWPWGEPLGPDPRDLARVLRLLALADFATTAAARGRALGGESP